MRGTFVSRSYIWWIFRVHCARLASLTSKEQALRSHPTESPVEHFTWEVAAATSIDSNSTAVGMGTIQAFYHWHRLITKYMLRRHGPHRLGRSGRSLRKMHFLLRKEITFEEVLRRCFPSCNRQQHWRQVLVSAHRKTLREAHRQSTLAKHTGKAPGSWQTHCRLASTQHNTAPVEVVCWKGGIAHRHFLWTAGEVWLWQEMGRNRTTRSQLLLPNASTAPTSSFYRKESLTKKGNYDVQGLPKQLATFSKQNLASIFTWMKGPEAFQITEITIMVVLSSGVEFWLLCLLMTAMSTKKRL